MPLKHSYMPYPPSLSLSMPSLLNPLAPPPIAMASNSASTHTTFPSIAPMASSSPRSILTPTPTAAEDPTTVDIAALANSCLEHLSTTFMSGSSDSQVAVGSVEELAAVRRDLEKIIGLVNDPNTKPDTKATTAVKGAGSMTQAGGTTGGGKVATAAVATLASASAAWKQGVKNEKMDVDQEGEDELGEGEEDEDDDDDEEDEDDSEESDDEDDSSAASDSPQKDSGFWKSSASGSTSTPSSNPILISTRKTKSKAPGKSGAKLIAGPRSSAGSSVAANVTLSTPPKASLGAVGKDSTTTDTEMDEPPRTYFFNGSSYPLTLPPGLHVPPREKWSDTCRKIYDEVVTELSPTMPVSPRKSGTHARGVAAGAARAGVSVTVAQIEAFQDKWKGGASLEEMSVAVLAFRAVYERTWAAASASGGAKGAKGKSGTGGGNAEVITAMQLALGRRRHALMTRLRRANHAAEKKGKKAAEAVKVKKGKGKV